MIETFAKEIISEKYKKIIIFSTVSIFSIYFLIEILTNIANIPHSDDWPTIFSAIYFQQNDHVWISGVLGGGNEHLLYFYRIVLMLIFQVNSYNISDINILNWGLLVVSVILFYHLLKKTDSRLTWLIIPISAFIFSPKFYIAAAFASVGFIWISTLLLVIISIVIFNKEKISKMYFLVAIFVAVSSSFSAVIGVLSWLVGFIYLFKRIRQNRSYFIIWTIAFLGIALLFSALARNSSIGRKRLAELLNVDAFNYSLEYVSNPFSIPFDIIEHIVGFSIIFSIITISIFLIIKKVNKSSPWIIFGIIGILSTILTTVGRFNISPANFSYFTIMSTITEISLLVLFSILFLESRNFKNNSLRKIISILFIIFIVSQMILLSDSYIHNYGIINEQSNFTQDYLYECFRLPSNTDDSCLRYNMFGDPTRPVTNANQMSDSEIYAVINFFIANKMAVFSNEDFFNGLEIDRLSLKDKIDQLTEIESSFGNVQTVNDYFVSDNEAITIKENFIEIKGMIWKENNNIDEIILFVNDKPFMSSKTFLLKQDIVDENNNTDDISTNWQISFFPAYLGNGCHDISLKGLNNESIYNIEKEFTLCIQNPEKYYPANYDPDILSENINKILTKPLNFFGISSSGDCFFCDKS